MPTQLLNIRRLSATLELRTGLLVGAGDTAMHIGGADKTVQRHPHTRIPYLPGSSLKGKMRSLLEWRAGLVGTTNGAPVKLEDLPKITEESRKAQAELILRLFGFPPKGGKDTAYENELKRIGPSRLSFWDCDLQAQWVQERKDLNQSLTEVKSENAINRVSGVAENPRFFERVPAGARFDFTLSWKVLDGDDDLKFKAFLLEGLRLLELDALGGQGSRGYGKVRFLDLKLDGVEWLADLEGIRPFADAA
ncbi:MAG TPA: type III-A CRISPR-associated RAMP protein Csm3 [Fibrobacteria bacterium]|nr:type III-A CRISPR-associated RAMP protein Csm3 [Fibrobacteria bacterium]HOX50219.1 type III-A CRISPR-associated RAMP protein Csm3 [Fibrobacteria bacterium]